MILRPQSSVHKVLNFTVVAILEVEDLLCPFATMSTFCHSYRAMNHWVLTHSILNANPDLYVPVPEGFQKFGRKI